MRARYVRKGRQIESPDSYKARVLIEPMMDFGR
jgi:hypothetical protein